MPFLFATRAGGQAVASLAVFQVPMPGGPVPTVFPNLASLPRAASAPLDPNGVVASPSPANVFVGR